MLVFSSGKKVVPSYLEGLILADPCIDQAVVCGDGRNFLTALIVPHWPNVREALRTGAAHFDSDTDDALSRHPAVYALLQQRIDLALKDVSSWEHVRKFAILPQPLSVAAEELTVSLKLRRNVVVEKYRQVLEGLYRESV